MRIQNRTAMVLLDLVIGILAALATWIQFINFGNDAWRLFATWVALLAAIYYIPNALITLLAKRRPVGTELSPMLQGALIVAGVTLLVTHIVCYAMDSYVPVVGVNVVIIDFILPVMMIISWVIFSIKGEWRAYEPFYWFGLLAAYASIILFTAEFMPRTARLAYPYEFFDYPSIGLDTMLWWAAIFAVVILIVGFLFWILDFIFSGKLAQNIVMPKIKTVVIEEEIEGDVAELKPEVAPKPSSKPRANKKPEEKPVRIVTTGGRNVRPKVTDTKGAEPQAAKPEAAAKDKAANKNDQNNVTKKDDTKATTKVADKVETDKVAKPVKATEKAKSSEPAAEAKESTKVPEVRIFERVEMSGAKAKKEPKAEQKSRSAESGWVNESKEVKAEKSETVDKASKQGEAEKVENVKTETAGANGTKSKDDAKAEPAKAEVVKPEAKEASTEDASQEQAKAQNQEQKPEQKPEPQAKPTESSQKAEKPQA